MLSLVLLSGVASAASASGVVPSGVAPSGVPSSSSAESTVATSVASTAETVSSVVTSGTGPAVSSVVPPVASSASTAENTTVTEEYTVFTTYCPEPTTFPFGGSTITVTAPTTLTLTECPDHECTKKPSTSASASAVIPKYSGTSYGNTTVTEDYTVFTTYCPEPTTFTRGGETFTVTAPTTLTITECPDEECTKKPSGSASATTSATGIHPSLNSTTAAPTVNAAAGVKVGAAAGLVGAVALLL